MGKRNIRDKWWYTHHYLPELADAGLEIDKQWYTVYPSFIDQKMCYIYKCSNVPSIIGSNGFNQNHADRTPPWVHGSVRSCQDLLGKDKTQKSLMKQVRDTRQDPRTSPDIGPVD